MTAAIEVATTTSTAEVTTTSPPAVEVTVTTPVVELSLLQGPQGVQGPQGDPGVAQRYVHTQAIPSDVWTIDHGLNCRPNVIIIDSGGTVQFGDVVYATLNQVVVTFSASFSGVAELS